MKDDSEITELKRKVDSLLEGLSMLNRTLLLLKLFYWIVVYHLSNFRSRFTRSRARIHWIGYYRRPRRMERGLFILCFFGAMLLLEPQQYIYWSVMWGGTLSIFLNLYTVYLLIPRKRAHWI